ncbi:hypothetical protein BC936DRAFT_141229 [Jimgerdemannia flammicorona]|uniref:Uncharacterized protein n=1 Tax=Jimgerdemannia flammicorona TaxID=994334 RepID=A0A433A2N9_9FUNG|nr:hypothetical protein BC936DRAFT_141229 [Jimgerdemannia flammicorona]
MQLDEPDAPLIDIHYVCGPIPYLRPKTATATFKFVRPPAARNSNHDHVHTPPQPPKPQPVPAPVTTVDKAHRARFYDDVVVRHMIRAYISSYDRFDEMIKHGFPVIEEDDCQSTTPSPTAERRPATRLARRRPTAQRCMTLRVTLTPWHCRADDCEIYGVVGARRETARLDDDRRRAGLDCEVAEVETLASRELEWEPRIYEGDDGRSWI